MLKTGAHLLHRNAFERSDFVWYICLRTFIGVETALALAIVATGDDIALTCEKERVRASATHLRDLFIKDIKSGESDRYVTVLQFGDAQLPILVVSPRVNFISTQDALLFFIPAACTRLSAEHGRKIKATGDLIHSHALESLNKDG